MCRLVAADPLQWKDQKREKTESTNSNTPECDEKKNLERGFSFGWDGGGFEEVSEEVSEEEE